MKTAVKTAVKTAEVVLDSSSWPSSPAAVKHSLPSSLAVVEQTQIGRAFAQRALEYEMMSVEAIAVTVWVP